MGYEFDDNGRYVGWSDLFDYSNIRTLRASEYLPIPDGVNYQAKTASEIAESAAKISELNASLSELNTQIATLNQELQNEELSDDQRKEKTEKLKSLKKEASSQQNELTNLKGVANSLDISEQITNIASITDKANKIRAYADLLSLLQDKGHVYYKGKKYTYVTWNDTISPESAKEVLGDLNLHSQTYLSPQKLEKCLKNSVSSAITNIIQNLRNMDQAYSPIEMETVRDASKDSPKGNKSDTMTLVNPLTKLLMQEQNMVGKGVIGISAVGEKVFFNVSHYWNEGLISGNERWIKNLHFKQTFDRIQGRSKDPMGLGTLTSVTKTTLANVNWENTLNMAERFARLVDIIPQLRLKWGITEDDLINHTGNWQQYKDDLLAQDSSVYADDMISQLLSAATDNAKELILAKINADTNLAKCHLHLIMMGFNISDIVSFMISPVVQIISDLSTANMFDEYLSKVNVDNAIKILRGEFPLNKFFYGRVMQNGESRALSQIAFSKIKDKLQAKLQSLGTYTMTKEKTVKQGGKKVREVVAEPPVYKSMSAIIKDYYDARVRGLINESLTEFVSGISANTRINHNLIAFSDYLDNVVSKVRTSGLDYDTQFRADLQEFDKVYQLASETSTLGSVLLGLNQGLPSSKVDLLNKVLKIQQAVANREKVFKITVADLNKENTRKQIIMDLLANNEFLTGEEVSDILDKAQDLGIVNNFDFLKWLEDDNGYRRATSDYYNIIKGTWNLFDIIDRLPHFKAIFQTFQAALTYDQACIKKSYILNKISKDLFENADYIDQQTISGLLDYVDDLLVLRWLNQQAFKFPVYNGDTIFKFNWKANTFKGQSSHIVIDEEATRGTLKKLIEERLFPHLREGYYYDIDENGNQVRVDIGKDNKFIKNLVFDINKDDQRYLKLDLDMQNTSATADNEGRYQECLSDFVKLKNFKLGPIQSNGRRLSIADWFMVYNLLINKNKFGRDRLTTLFGQFLGMIKEESVVYSIMKETGDLDYSEVDNINTMEDLIEWGYNRDDALYKIAPIVTKAQEANSTAKLIKQYKDGRIVVKRRYYQDYSDSEEIIPNSTDYTLDENESKVDLITRLSNYMNYGVLRTPFANKRSQGITNLSSSEKTDVLSALVNYLKQGIIEITTENC